MRTLPAIFLLATCLLMSRAVVSDAGSVWEGVVVAKQGNELRVKAKAGGGSNAGVPPGSTAIFETEIAGFKAEAGSGVVRRMEAGLVVIEITEGEPDVSMTVKIAVEGTSPDSATVAKASGASPSDAAIAKKSTELHPQSSEPQDFCEVLQAVIQMADRGFEQLKGTKKVPERLSLPGSKFCDFHESMLSVEYNCYWPTEPVAVAGTYEPLERSVAQCLSVHEPRTGKPNFLPGIVFELGYDSGLVVNVVQINSNTLTSSIPYGVIVGISTGTEF